MDMISTRLVSLSLNSMCNSMGESWAKQNRLQHDAEGSFS